MSTFEKDIFNIKSKKKKSSSIINPMADHELLNEASSETFEPFEGNYTVVNTYYINFGVISISFIYEEYEDVMEDDDEEETYYDSENSDENEDDEEVIHDDAH